jgi:hypothetical protein
MKEDIEWVIDYDALDKFPKWKQQEINDCDHEWWTGETVMGTPCQQCVTCGVPRHDKASE